MENRWVAFPQNALYNGLIKRNCSVRSIEDKLIDISRHNHHLESHSDSTKQFIYWFTVAYGLFVNLPVICNQLTTDNYPRVEGGAEMKWRRERRGGWWVPHRRSSAYNGGATGSWSKSQSVNGEQPSVVPAIPFVWSIVCCVSMCVYGCVCTCVCVLHARACVVLWVDRNLEGKKNSKENNVIGPSLSIFSISFLICLSLLLTNSENMSSL